MRFLSILAAVAALSSFANGLTSSLTRVDAFASVAGDVAMYVYIPASKTPNPAIVVAIHSCERTAGYYFDNTAYAALADAYGYIVVYPNSSALRQCWDTSSPQTTTHNGGGHSQAIANMVSYAANTYNGDLNRVFVTGSSSGGIMVNLLAGLYPEVFKAASVFSGLYSGAIYPYSGRRPKMLIWHGTIDDKYPYFPSYTDEMRGWSGVLGVSFSHNITDSPQGGYTRMIYGDGSQLVGISAAGVGHTVPVDATTDLAWFCIFPECDLGFPPVSGSSSSSSTLSSTTSSTTSSSSSLIPSSTSSSSSSTISSSSELPSSTSSSEIPTLTPTPSPTITPSNTAASETAAATTSAAVVAAPVSHGLSAGAKAGISVGAVVGALLVVAAAAFLIRKRRQNPNSTEPESAMASNPEGSGPGMAYSGASAAAAGTGLAAGGSLAAGAVAAKSDINDNDTSIAGDSVEQLDATQPTSTTELLASNNTPGDGVGEGAGEGAAEDEVEIGTAQGEPEMSEIPSHNVHTP